MSIQDGDRRRLVHVAYRLLGTYADAEDAVQTAYARWFALAEEDRSAIANPVAWLTTATSRICLDQLRSARTRRERYVGSWLPEPLPDDPSWTTGLDPADEAVLTESLSTSFLVVLDTMTPAERVAFVLHDVYRYPYAEIAPIVDRTPAACRQLASSGRARLRTARVPEPTSSEQAELVDRFRRAWQAHDIDALVTLLDPEVVMVADGGGRVRAALTPVAGGVEVARFCAGLVDRAPGLTLVPGTVNGRPGLLGVDGATVVTVFSFQLSAGRIRRVWAVRNPDKLELWRDGAERVGA